MNRPSPAAASAFVPVVLRGKPSGLVFATVETPEIEAFRQEMPAALGEQGKYDASVAAAIINGKFGLHIPYYRLQDIFSASGWTPTRSTIDYQTDLAAEAIEELPKLMIRRLTAGQYVGMFVITGTR